MARQHGSKARAYCEDRDLSSYFRSLSLSQEVDTGDVSVLTSAGREFVAGLAMATLSAESPFSLESAGAGLEDLLHGASPAFGANDKVLVYLPQGDGAGNVAYGLQGIINGDELGTDTGDAGVESIEVQASGGADRGIVLHALGAETATANGTTQDQTAATAKGGVGFLVCTAAAGTTPTLDVKIQHSTNGSTWADLITFTQRTAKGAQRSALGETVTVNRYVRAIWTIGGTGGPSFTFNVVFARRI